MKHEDYDMSEPVVRMWTKLAQIRFPEATGKMLEYRIAQMRTAGRYDRRRREERERRT